MATVTYIKEKKQQLGAMRGVMRYCMREDKTFDRQTGQRFVSGINCEWKPTKPPPMWEPSWVSPSAPPWLWRKIKPSRTNRTTTNSLPNWNPRKKTNSSSKPCKNTPEFTKEEIAY